MRVSPEVAFKLLVRATVSSEGLSGAEGSTSKLAHVVASRRLQFLITRAFPQGHSVRGNWLPLEPTI